MAACSTIGRLSHLGSTKRRVKARVLGTENAVSGSDRQGTSVVPSAVMLGSDCASVPPETTGRGSYSGSATPSARDAATNAAVVSAATVRCVTSLTRLVRICSRTFLVSTSTPFVATRPSLERLLE